MNTGIVFHNEYLKHKQIENHPENPQRLETTMEYFLKTQILDVVEQLNPEPASLEDLERVHSKAHVQHIKSLSEMGHGRFGVIDSDTYVCEHTYSAALLAAGGVMAAGEAVWKGELDNCFALVRPPGHHASKNQATGFCYFDNISIMVKYLQARHNVKKVFIFDWDAHAPNGTMGTFYTDPGVLNMSIHQDPRNFYPGHGFIDQMGEEAGRGYTINFPVPAGTGDADYLHFLNEFVVPRVRKFKPDLIAVAAGQDSHISDFISQLNVTDAGYASMTKTLMDLADEVCKGKLVLELEGGYNLKTLPATNHKILSTLTGIPPEKEIEGKILESTRTLLQKLNDSLKSSKLWQEGPDPVEADVPCEEKQK